jgi:hypothetical protein
MELDKTLGGHDSSLVHNTESWEFHLTIDSSTIHNFFHYFLLSGVTITLTKIVNTGFIGQGYGDATEKKIMKEIMYGGAVNGEMKFPRLGVMYKGGIMTAKGLVQLHQDTVELA